MRQLILATLLAAVSSAQTLINPADIPAATKALEYHEGEKNLRCDVLPSKPALNFGLRLQAGYLLEVPLVQYYGAGHTWTTTLRVTPEGGRAPAYLTDRIDLPVTSHPEFTAQTTGTFLLGEGRYHVEFAVTDDTGRICRKEWQIAAAPDRSERSIKVAMPPGAVADLSYSPTAGSAPAGTPVPRRITVLMNSSPPYKPRIRFQPGTMVPGGPPEFVDYREALLGILSSLLEKLPGTAVRLAVFDLDQQREVLRQDNFTLKDMAKAAHAADDLEHWVVTVRELQEQPGKWGLLANLIRREINEPEQSDVILFLGPRIGSAGEMPAHFLEIEKRAEERFLYLQYSLAHEGILTGLPPEMRTTPPDRRPSTPGGPRELDPLDAIDLTVARLKGKTLTVYSPLEFAKAIETIKHR
jgi:hypothetical protein